VRPIRPAAGRREARVGTGICRRSTSGRKADRIVRKTPGCVGGERWGPDPHDLKRRRGRWPRSLREGPNNEDSGSFARRSPRFRTLLLTFSAAARSFNLGHPVRQGYGSGGSAPIAGGNGHRGVPASAPDRRRPTPAAPTSCRYSGPGPTPSRRSSRGGVLTASRNYVPCRELAGHSVNSHPGAEVKDRQGDGGPLPSSIALSTSTGPTSYGRVANSIPLGRSVHRHVRSRPGGVERAGGQGTTIPSAGRPAWRTRT